MTDLSYNSINSAIRFATLVLSIIKIYIDVCLAVFQKPVKKNIKGQNALITGSGHGLGRELAKKFAQQGVNLALVDINEANNESVKNEILKINSSISVHTYSIDIRDEKQVCGLAKSVQNDLGHVDILVNNAGIVQCLPFLELSPALIERTFQVNTYAHFWTIKHFLPVMIKNKRGHIVAIASLAGLLGSKYLTDYCASKFAVVGLMESLDIEIHDNGANENIFLTTICPASMSTGMFQSFTSRFKWFLPVLNADQVASNVIDAVLSNKTLVVIPNITLFLHRLSYILPQKVRMLVQDYLDYGVRPHVK